MDIELAVDALELAPHLDEMVLFSGDGDFRSLVERQAFSTVRRFDAENRSLRPPILTTTEGRLARVAPI
jgi:hypothetical protein